MHKAALFIFFFFFYFGVFYSQLPWTLNGKVYVKSVFVNLLCSLTVMSLVYHGLKAYLITAVQTHHNRVNIIKITLCTLTNLRDIQIYCALVLEAVAQLILPKHAVKDLYSQS